MELGDWLFVARNALWIAGLSMVLAAWSYASWRAAARCVRVRQVLAGPALQAPLLSGLLLFVASMAWGADSPWERAVWIGLGVALAGQLAAGLRTALQSGGDMLAAVSSQ